MQTGPNSRLQPAHLFYLACRDAFRDGRIEPREQAILNRVHHALDLNTTAVKGIAAQARKDAEARGFQDGSALDPERVMQQAVDLAVQMGSEDEESVALLDRFRLALLGAMEAVGPAPGAPREAPAPPAPPAPPQAPQAPQAPRPPPAAVPRPAAAPSPPPATAAGYQPPPWEEPMPARSVRGSGVPGGGELVPAGKGEKGSVDSGGEEVHRVPGPYGDESYWRLSDLFSISARVLQDHAPIWGGMLAFSTLASVALENSLATLLVVLLTTPFTIAITAAIARGDPPADLAEAWHRTTPHIARYAWTFFMASFVTGLALGGATLLGTILALVMGAMFGSGGSILGGLTAVILGLLTFRTVLYMTIYSAQVSVIEEKSGYAALTAAKELTHARSSDLIGLEAIGMMILMAIGSSILGMGAMMVGMVIAMVLPFGGMAVIGFLGAAIHAVFTLYGQIAWTLLYLRARQRLLLS